MTKPKMPKKYKHLLTGSRGEDCNETVCDIAVIVAEGLSGDDQQRMEALQAIAALCYATENDSVD